MKSRLLVLWLACIASFACCGCTSASGKDQLSAAHRSAPVLMIQYGCPTCHVIPNVPGAVGKVGPSLDSVAQRSYIAGVLPNSPSNLERWVMHPQSIHPGTAMPDMGVTQSDAQTIAAFLQTNH